MLRAVIFDFNGILVDDEPIHLAMFQKVLGEEGISLDKEDYYARYLGMDDRGCFMAAFHDQDKNLDEAMLEQLIARKGAYYQEAIRNQMTIFPGVIDLVPLLAARFPLAIASGALKHEIEKILVAVGLKQHFYAIVSAEDVRAGKPEPEIFLRALDRLNPRFGTTRPLQPSECLVIEDSKEGVRGARRAGMKCLAVTNSHPAEELTEAHKVVKTLEEVTVPFLETLFA